MTPLKRLFSFMKPYQVKFGCSLFFAVTYTLARASQPFLIGLAISELARNMQVRLTTGVGGVNFSYIGGIVVALIVTSAIDFMGDYLSSRLLADVVQDTMADVRTTINRKINRLPVSYFDSRQQGEILSRITGDVDTLGNALQQGSLRVLSAFLTLVFSVSFMFYLSPFFASISLIMYPIVFFGYRFYLRKNQATFQELQDVLGDMTGFVQEYYTGFPVVKLFGQEEAITKKYDKILDQLYDVGFRSNFAASSINPLLSTITHLMYILLFLLCGILVLNKPLIIGGVVVAKAMEIGGLQSFIQYVWQAGGPISDVTQLSGVFQAAAASLSRIFSILDDEEESPDPSPYPVSLEQVQGDVAFQNVRFGYDPENPLMENINFSVKSGEMVAVVGPTGAGKTTLINLLMRFYDVDSGAITIDGINIQDLTRAQLRSLFGMVLQDPWLYYATITDNIRFGNLDANDYQVVDAAKTANVHRFIRTLPEGYNTMLNKESSNVSQGQKQLLTIARVLVGNPRIVILDEATSSVDTRLELLIQKAMKKTTEGRTSFVIAHRLSTIRDADLILVMDHGSIVEHGTHEELLKKDGMYKQLYESQFATEAE